VNIADTQQASRNTPPENREGNINSEKERERKEKRRGYTRALFITLHGRRVFSILTIKHIAEAGSTNSRRKVRLRIKKEEILEEKAQNKRGAVHGRSENCVTFAMVIVSSHDGVRFFLRETKVLLKKPDKARQDRPVLLHEFIRWPRASIKFRCRV